MHQDIEKLLSTAKEKGSITEKQREIILSKAQQLEEDMAEVEFLLEDIPLKKNETTRVKTKRCPHCGAVMSDMEQVCPEGIARLPAPEARCLSWKAMILPLAGMRTRQFLRVGIPDLTVQETC